MEKLLYYLVGLHCCAPLKQEMSYMAEDVSANCNHCGSLPHTRSTFCYLIKYKHPTIQHDN